MYKLIIVSYLSEEAPHELFYSIPSLNCSYALNVLSFISCFPELTLCDNYFRASFVSVHYKFYSSINCHQFLSRLWSTLLFLSFIVGLFRMHFILASQNFIKVKKTPSIQLFIASYLGIFCTISQLYLQVISIKPYYTF